jgi:hypothetical protein
LKSACPARNGLFELKQGEKSVWFIHLRGLQIYAGWKVRGFTTCFRSSFEVVEAINQTRPLWQPLDGRAHFHFYCQRTREDDLGHFRKFVILATPDPVVSISARTPGLIRSTSASRNVFLHPPSKRVSPRIPR